MSGRRGGLGNGLPQARVSSTFAVRAKRFCKTPRRRAPLEKTPCPRNASQSEEASPTRRQKIFYRPKKIDARPFPRDRRLMKSARQKRVFPEKHSSCHHIFYEHIISHSISMPGTLLLTHAVTLHPPCGEKVSASVVLLCPSRSSTESFQNVKTKKYHGDATNLFFHNLIFPCVTIFFHDIVGCLYHLCSQGVQRAEPARPCLNKSGPAPLQSRFGPCASPFRSRKSGEKKCPSAEQACSPN